MKAKANPPLPTTTAHHAGTCSKMASGKVKKRKARHSSGNHASSFQPSPTPTLAHSSTSASDVLSTNATPPKIKRPPNAFMIFASKERKVIVALCNNRDSDGTCTLAAVLRTFAEQSYVPQSAARAITAQQGSRKRPTSASKSKVPPASIPKEEWLANLGLAQGGDWSSVKSVPNNIISKMLARKWNWLNLTKPKEAQTYFGAQRKAKAAHGRENPGYKYAPEQNGRSKKKQKDAGASKKKAASKSTSKFKRRPTTGLAPSAEFKIKSFPTPPTPVPPTPTTPICTGTAPTAMPTAPSSAPSSPERLPASHVPYTARPFEATSHYSKLSTELIEIEKNYTAYHDVFKRSRHLSFEHHDASVSHEAPSTFNAMLAIGMASADTGAFLKSFDDRDASESHEAPSTAQRPLTPFNALLEIADSTLTDLVSSADTGDFLESFGLINEMDINVDTSVLGSFNDSGCFDEGTFA